MKNKDHDKERRDPLYSDIPEWLQEFRENLVDDGVAECRDSHASSFHEVSLEPTFKRREVLGKHRVYTHFPKDRNCEICKRTKITSAPCRTRIAGAVPRTEIFGDLITADHKILVKDVMLVTITNSQSRLDSFFSVQKKRLLRRRKRV